MVAAGIYLYQAREFQSAIKVLKSPLRANDPTAEFYTALSHHSLGGTASANHYLTKACTNKKRTEDINKFCITDEK